MANEEQIRKLNSTVSEVKSESSWNGVQERHQNLQKKKEQFDDIKDEAESIIKEYINDLAEEDKNSKGVATYDKQLTVKNGNVYSYGNGYDKGLRKLVNSGKTRKRLENHLPNELSEVLDIGLEIYNISFDDEQLKGKKLLPGTDSEFDGVTFYLKSNRCGIKLVDSLGTGRSCSRTRVDFKSTDVEHIEAVLKHLDAIDDVISQVEGNVDEVIDERDKKLKELKEKTGVE